MDSMSYVCNPRVASGFRYSSAGKQPCDHHPAQTLTPVTADHVRRVHHLPQGCRASQRIGDTEGGRPARREKEGCQADGNRCRSDPWWRHAAFPHPAGSIAGRTMQESVYRPRPKKRRLREEAPNVLIVLIDDAGPGLPDTFGEVRTDTLSRICAEGVSYNRFHTTAMCSPTRAALLTGRNHHRVGNGQIAELANDWDGYSGHIPRSSATAATVLRHYGYSTGRVRQVAQHPAEETTAADRSTTGPPGWASTTSTAFLAGEASQYEPNLVRNTTLVAPPKTPEQGYHLSADLADDAIDWLRKHKAFDADKPFFMYWASGCLHGRTTS
ncbi:sulfatase-like hydrolase/transferase [Rhodococcus opacus]|nr:sulfatase-like hydrolase/transferase [Rhodococcus opacus]